MHCFETKFKGTKVEMANIPQKTRNFYSRGFLIKMEQETNKWEEHLQKKWV